MFRELDRTGWVVVVSCGVALVLWSFLLAPKMAPPPASMPDEEAPQVQHEPVVQDTGLAPARMEVSADLRTEEAEFQFTTTGGGLADARILDHAKELGSEERVVLNEVGRRNPSDRPHPIGALGERGADTGGNGFDLRFEASEYSMQAEGKFVTLKGSHGDLGVAKVFSLPGPGEDGRLPDGHVVQMEITLENKGGVPLDLSRFFIYAGAASAVNNQPMGNMDTGLVYQDKGRVTLRRVDWFKRFMLRPERESYATPVKQLDWMAVQSQFFTTIVRPVEQNSSGVWARPFQATIDGDLEESTRLSSRGIEGAVGLPRVPLGPGEKRSFHYEIYLGPKEFSRLASLPVNQHGVMVYDKIPVFGALFGWVIRPIAQILVQVLVFFKGWTGNAGIAVLLLTIVVRAIMWPLHAKAHMTSKRMSLLTPKLNELKEKYPDDPQKMQQEQMKLWGEYGINPMGGCLPAFFQMPIFIGYFRMLASATELRHEPFVAWIRDLSMPDTITTLPIWLGGLDLNLLPILMAATSYLQFAMMPKTGDPNQRIMFMMFPLMFLFFCYTYASALALYWTWSNVISAAQTWIFNKRPIPPLVKQKGGRRKSWMERLQEQAETAKRVQRAQEPRQNGVKPAAGASSKPAARPTGPSLTSLSGRSESSSNFGEKGPRKQKAKRKPQKPKRPGNRS